MSDNRDRFKWSVGDPFPASVPAAAAVTVGGLLLQVGGFWYGFQVTTGWPPNPGLGRGLVVLGLLGSIGMLWLGVRLWRLGWLRLVAVVVPLLVGGLVGYFVATRLPNNLGGGLIFGELGLYYRLVIGALGGSALIFWFVAADFHSNGNGWWTSFVGIPLFLLTGAHVSLLVGLWVQADELAVLSREATRVVKHGIRWLPEVLLAV